MSRSKVGCLSSPASDPDLRADDICDLWGVNTVEHILVHCSNPVISSAQGRWRRMHHLQNKSVPH